MRPIATLLVCSVQASDALVVGACWDGGPTIGIHIEQAGRTVRARRGRSGTKRGTPR
jgi:hypothetical protein